MIAQVVALPSGGDLNEKLKTLKTKVGTGGLKHLFRLTNQRRKSELVVAIFEDESALEKFVSHEQATGALEHAKKSHSDGKIDVYEALVEVF